MELRQLAAGVVVAAAVTFAVAQPASADAKKGGQVLLHCETLGDVLINTNTGNGAWTPGQVVAGNMVLLPYEFHLAFTFTPTEGDPVSGSQDSVKKPPKNGRLDNCSFSVEFTDPYGSGVYGGDVKVSYTKG